MANCICSGLVAGLSNFVSKDGKPGCNLQLRVSSGELYPFFVRQQLPVYDFGTPVTVVFDVSFFNGKPGNLIATDVELSKKKGD